MDEGWNWALARSVNGLAGRSGLADLVMAAIATYLIFALVLAAASWWLWPGLREKGKLAALAAAVAVVAGQAFNLLVGWFVFVPRPFVAHHVLLLVQSARDSSFPSDHATAAFGIAATALLWRMPGRWLILIGAILIAVARVYVGAHYPLDVIAGAVLGSFWAALVRVIVLKVDPARFVDRHGALRALSSWMGMCRGDGADAMNAESGSEGGQGG